MAALWAVFYCSNAVRTTYSCHPDSLGFARDKLRGGIWSVILNSRAMYRLVLWFQDLSAFCYSGLRAGIQAPFFRLRQLADWFVQNLMIQC